MPLVLAVACLVGAGAVGSALARPVATVARDPVTVVIRPGMGLRQIALSLRAARVIRRAWVFEVLAVSGGEARRLQAGTYALSPSMPPQVVLQRIASGEVVTGARRITIPEGWNATQIIAALAAAHLGHGQAALAAAATDPALLAAAALPAPAAGTKVALEGYLYPDTYSFSSTMSAAQILGRMLSEFDAVWTPQLAAAARANAQLDTAQTVTLASIVQREVADAAQMPLVAGIYLHRLRVGMRLDADPTVLYALGLLSQQHSLTLAQTATVSPYNTYVVAGLPPGPICNPGKAALEAVAHPAATNALYFLTDPRGRVIPADTLQQQIAHQQKYYGD